jgi:tetratricopeptide (TPR) repeat protein
MTEEAAAKHQLGVAATARGAPAEGAAVLREGLRLLGWPRDVTDRPLAARLLISLAHAEAEQGQLDAGIALLETASVFVDEADRGVAQQQRGLLLLRAGRFEESRDCFDEALPRLPGRVDIEARTYLNRGVARQALGDIAGARDDFRRSAERARLAGLAALAIKAEHNGGYCDYLAGDIPSALRAFAEAERALGDEPGLVAVVLIDRARALLSVGLVRDAQRDLERAVTLFASQRLRQDQAEAELTRAHAALAAGDDRAVLLWAGRARDRFRRRGNDTGVALAELARLSARQRTDPGLVPAAVTVAATLRRAGLLDDADRAGLIAVRSAVARRNLELASDLAVRLRAAAAVEVRLLARLAAAEQADARGDQTGARRHITAGLSTLEQHRSRFGSLDLQVGMLSPAVELATFGVGLAWRSGSPAVVYAMAERARAQSSRITPVRPAPDERLTATLAELRQARAGQHQAALAGRPAPAGAATQIAELERLVRQGDWETGGSGRAEAVAGLPRVLAELDHTGATMVLLVAADGRLGAVVLDPRRHRTTTLIDLGDQARLAEAVLRVRGDVDVLASRHLPDRLATVLRDSLRTNACVVDEWFAQVEPRGGHGPLVLVPTGALLQMPWGCVPRLRERPVSVAPSATQWLRAAGTSVSAVDSCVVVGGPDLPAAAAEVWAVAGVRPGAHVLTGEMATVDSVLAAMDGADTVHVAAHGEHAPDNGLFSRIWLADGPLMAYDIQRLNRPPRHVVLAACDVGQAAVHPGDDVLGLASTCLQAGTATVIASVTRVTDETALAVMSTYHRRLADGLAPAAALAQALASGPLASFVCFGA